MSRPHQNVYKYIHPRYHSTYIPNITLCYILTYYIHTNCHVYVNVYKHIHSRYHLTHISLYYVLRVGIIRNFFLQKMAIQMRAEYLICM